MAELPLAPEGVIPGLSAETSARLLAVLTAEPAVQDIWLYGSRAMGRHHPGSDIDLTLVAPTLRHDDRLRLMAALDDLLLPWSIDLSLHHDLPEPLRQHVARVGLRLHPAGPTTPPHPSSLLLQPLEGGQPLKRHPQTAPAGRG